ncbi:STAS domain-containing protein [Actinophytocola glycyrrhizae]|uniref:Anti-sigma factor antagonist n=1 Tax=Actinophytocola glycyrrhizae TaxID=2044873 RepID=A0ABV9SC62_9PSEU
MPDINDEARDDSPLTLRCETSAHAVVIHAVGEVDHPNAIWLSEELTRVGATISPAQSLVLDLTGVSFMGSATIAALIEHDRQCRQSGCDLRIVTGNTTVTRSLQRTGILDLLPVYRTLSEALADNG